MRLRRLIAWATAGCSLLLVLPGYARYVSASLQGQAAALADGQAYCVQVAGRSGYRPARGPEDTRGLFMLGHGGYHHAALVVGDVRAPRTYHWSYFRNGFVEGSYGPFPIVCTPLRDYFARIGKMPVPAASAPQTFSLLGRTVSIPRAYRGGPQWPGSLVGYTVLATAPGFGPAAEPCSGGVCNMVHVAFRGGTTPQAMAWSVRETERASAARQPERLHALPGTHRYIQVGRDGQVRTYVACRAEATTQCLHVFSHDGLGYSFHHLPADLPQWELMQQRLVALQARFEAGTAR